jgi:hypothetical protein
MLAEDFRTRQSLADLERAAGDDPPGGDCSAAFDVEAPLDWLWSATACLLWQALMGHAKDPFLEDIWDQRRVDLIAAPAPIRAALMNGFDRLHDLGLLSDHCKSRPEDLVTVTRASLEAALMTIAREMTEEEIDHVARADYGCDMARHRTALQELLLDPALAYPEGEDWFPAEVVELVAHVPGNPGHVPCLAIVLLDALRTGDSQGNAEYRLGQQATAITALPPPGRDVVLAAFRHLYESVPRWSPSPPAPFTLPWVSLP